MAPHVWTCLQGTPSPTFFNSYQWHACCATHVLARLCTILAGRPMGLPRACTALPIFVLRLLNLPTLCLISCATLSALDRPLCLLRSFFSASSQLLQCTTLRRPGKPAPCLRLVLAWARNQPLTSLRSLVGVSLPLHEIVP